MDARPHIVYATWDGLLEPLGYSQVVRVVTQLARRGRHRFTICSLEKQSDRSDADRERRLDARLRSQHVRWRRSTFSEGGSPLEVLRNAAALYRLVDEVVDNHGAGLVHARSYMPAAVARRVSARHGVPYLFDTRGFWVDERIENGRWLGGPVGRRAARVWEANLYRDAAGAVMLTDIAADEIADNPAIPGRDHRPVAVIPTCVDYDEFQLGTSANGQAPDQIDWRRLEQSLVIGYIGSVKPVYPLAESLRLFDHVLARREDAHLLCLTRNTQAVHREVSRLALPDHSYTITAVEHHQIPRWLQLVDWGLLLRDTHPHQRGYIAAMPTKLAEFFASGVRPVFCGASPEVRSWVERAGSGVVVERLDEQAIREAADDIAATDASPNELWEARWRTRSHFGLDAGIERYDQIYRKLIGRGDKPRMRVLFLTEGTTVPASRFRVQQLVPHLQQRGIDCTVRCAYGDSYNRLADTPAAPVYKLACRLQRIPYSLDADRFDAVVLQRPALPFSSFAERIANWRNPHTIFDVDDAIFVDPDSGETHPRMQRAFEQIVRRCAHVICGNDYLAEHTRHLTPTTVIPTVVDTEVYRPPGEEDTPADDGVVVGWMGTASNFESLRSIAGVLRGMVARFDRLQLQLVSNRRFEPLQGVEGVVQKTWSAHREVELLQGFDIGLMPLVDNPVTRGKCGFKAIQYMAVATPVVASPVGVNEEILLGSDAGILADGPRGFEEAICELIQAPQKRRKMGRCGRQLVEQHYSVQAVIDRYVELLEAVARRAPARPAQTGAMIAEPSAGPMAEL